jgi:hypothetical protein
MEISNIPTAIILNLRNFESINHWILKIVPVLVIIPSLVACSTNSVNREIQPLEQLLQLVKQDQVRQANIDQQRVAAALNELNRIRKLLAQAREKKEIEVARKVRLQARFESNRIKLDKLLGKVIIPTNQLE